MLVHDGLQFIDLRLASADSHSSHRLLNEHGDCFSLRLLAVLTGLQGSFLCALARRLSYLLLYGCKAD
jgi:hypothetical protein